MGGGRVKPGSGVLPPAVIEALPALSAVAAKVAMALSRNMNRAGRCWPGQKKLAAAIGLSVRSV